MRSSQLPDLTKKDLPSLLPKRGLETSSWAPNGSRFVHTSSSSPSNWDYSRPGDWTCPTCRFSNYQWRDACLRCSTPTRTDGMGKDILKSAREGPHICERIHPSLGQPCRTKFARLYDLQRHEDLIHGGRLQPTDDTMGKQDGAEHNDIHVHTPEAPGLTLGSGHGLSTSRWAPRNYAGRPKRANVNEVWIRTVPTPNKAPPVTEILDLGLPYEVQHCILTIIQRILEEACYDFASRWLPKLLHENKWTCSEAVELSTWRRTLPTSVPQHAILPVKNYTLEAALADAVRIRNSATHRHLESNHELRRMALQARDLMTMFSDASRELKFTHLWTELNEWEAGSVNNEQAARNRLQEALQEIGERPMDEMDWTPNSVSLQEITSASSSEEPPLLLQETQDQDPYLDVMEID